MPKIRAKIRVGKLDKARVFKTYRALMERELRNAIRAWLKAVLLRVPKYTGTTRGVFKPIARVLRISLTTFMGPSEGDPVRARAKLKRGFTIFNGRVIILGEASGATYGSHKFSRRGSTFTFEFTNLLPWFAINEFTSGATDFNYATPPPWESYKAGELAFNDYVKNVLPTKREYKKLVTEYKIQEWIIG
jgi:hypothetical protein